MKTRKIQSLATIMLCLLLSQCSNRGPGSEDQGAGRVARDSAPASQAAAAPVAQASQPGAVAGEQTVRADRAPASTARAPQSTTQASRSRVVAEERFEREGELRVRLETGLSSATVRDGEPWSGRIINDVILDGETIAKPGDEVDGVVATSPSQQSDEPAKLSLLLTSVNGREVMASPYRRVILSAPKAKRDREGSAGLIGALAGAKAGGSGAAGSGKEASAASGAAAGAGSAPGSHPAETGVALPAGSIVEFRIQEPRASTGKAKK